MQVSTLLLFEIENHWEWQEVGDLIEGMEDEMLPEFLMVEGDVELLAVYLQPCTVL